MSASNKIVIACLSFAIGSIVSNLDDKRVIASALYELVSPLKTHENGLLMRTNRSLSPRNKCEENFLRNHDELDLDTIEFCKTVY